MSAQLNGRPAPATASDARFLDLIAQAPVAMSVLRGPDLVIEAINAAMLRIAGRGEEIIGMPTLMAFPEVAGQPAWDLMQSVYRTGNPVRLDEVPVTLAQDGIPQEGFYNLIYTPLVEGGAITGVLQAVTDVTGQVRARRAAEESKARLGAAVSAVQGILWTNDAEGKMVGEQPGWAALTGQSFDEYQGYGWATALHPDDAQPTVDAWKSSVRERKTFVFEHRVRRADGSWGQYSIRAIPLTEEDGAIREWVGVHTDITEQRHAERELAYRQALLEAQNEAIPDAILITDTKGGMISFNRHFAEVWNIPEEIIARKDDAAALQFAMTQLADPQAFIEGVNYCYAFPDDAHDHTEILFKDGRAIERWGNAVKGEDGTRYGWAWYFRDVTARKAAERDTLLKDRAFAASANGICISGADTPDSPIVYVNEAFERMTGYSAEEILGQDCRFLQAGDRDQPEIARLREALDRGQPCSVVLRNYKKDGTLFYNELSVSPVVDGGKLVHFVGIQQDITERRRTEEALRESERRFRSIFNGQFLFLAILAPDGRVLDINELPLQAVGAGREDVVGKIFWDTAWWRDLPDMRAGWPLRLVEAAAATGLVFSEDRFQTATGEVRVADASITAVKDAAGAVEFFIVQASDITERKAAEEALRQSEDRYQSFVRQSTDGIWRFEIDEPVPVTLPVEEQIDRVFSGAVLAECNDAFARMYGYERGEELIGKRIGEFMPRDESGEAYIRHFVESGYRIAGLESRETDREGREIFLMNSLLGIVEEGKVQRAWGTQRDVTEEKRRARALAESEARFRTFIEDAPVATCVWMGRELVVDVINAPMLYIWGRTHEEVIGKPLAEALPELEGQPFLKILDDVFTTGVMYEARAMPCNLVRDGVLNTYYFDFTYQPLRNAAGEVYAIMDMAVDVTAGVLAQQKIEASQQQLLVSFEQSPVGIALISPDDSLTFRMVNPFYGSLVDRTPEELVGKPLLEAVPEIAGQGFDDLLKNVVASDTPYVADEVPVDVKRGEGIETIFVNLAYQPVREASGVVSSILVVATDVTAGVTARKAVEEREAQFRDFSDNLQSLAWMADSEGWIYWYNQRWYDYTGTTFDAMQRWGMEKVHHPEHIGRVQDFVREAWGKPESFELTFPLRSKSGEYRWFLTRAVPVLDAEGNILRWIGTNTDIHEQRLAEEAVREREARFRALANDTPAFMFSADAAANVEFVNRAWLRFTGMEDQRGTGMAWAGITHPDDLQPMMEVYTRAVENLKPYQFEIRQKGTDGEWHWILWSGIPRTDAAGKFIGIMGVGVDVTAQKTAGQAMERSEARFRSVIQAAPAAMGLFVGQDLVIESPNQTFIDIVGKGWDVVGKPLREAMPELITEGQPFLKILDDVFTTGVPFVSPAAQVKIVQDGVMTDNFYNITYTPLFDADGKVYAILDIAIDVTAQVQAQKDLEESELFARTLIEHSPVAKAVYMGEDLITETMNGYMLELTGRTPDVIGKPWAQTTPELAGTVVEDQLRGVLRTGESVHFAEARVDHIRHGQPYTGWYNYTYKALRDIAGDIYGVMATAVEVTESVKAREELEQQRAYLQNALDIGNLGTYRVDLATGIGHFTENIREWFGLSATEQPLEKMMACIYPDDRTAVEEVVGRSATGPAHAHHDVLYRTTDDRGTIRHLRSIGRANYKDGTAESITGIIQDVTAQVEAQRRIEESEARLRAVIESAPIPIGIYVGRELRIQFANQAIIAIFGKGPDVIGKTYTEVLPELKGSGIFEQLRGVIATGEAFHATGQRLDLVVDGAPRTFYFNYSFTPVRDAGGTVYAVMNTAADVTDVFLAKQKVEEAEAALRGAIELAELGTWSLDAPSGVVTYSPRVQEWFGLGEEQSAHTAVYNPIHERDRERVTAAIAAALDPAGEGIYDEEYAVVAQGTGRERVLHAQGKTFFGPGGAPLRLSGTVQDITKQRALQTELERQVQERTAELADAARALTRSNEELSQYAYVASHDLQEPLRKIQMFSGILDKHSEIPEGAKTYVNRISGAAERMSTLIQSLLEFSRLQKGGDTLMRPVNLGEVARDVVQDFELAIAERGARVEIGELPVVEGVGLQMNQLFYNLVGNALKFTREDVTPEVRIAARTISAAEADGRLDGPPTAAHYHHITVTDNGIGFEVRYAEQIFEVFKRLHGRDAFPGSGIGLALCRRIVANHGGALWAESEVGHGSTFNILLPEGGA